MKTIKAYGYMVTAPKRMMKEIKKNMQDKKSHINWFNFSLGDMFYTDNGNYQVSMVAHEDKIIWFEHPYMKPIG